MSSPHYWCVMIPSTWWPEILEKEDPSINIHTARFFHSPLPKIFFFLIDWFSCLCSILYISPLHPPFYQHHRISDVYSHCLEHRAPLDYCCSVRILWVYKAEEEFHSERAAMGLIGVWKRKQNQNNGIHRNRNWKKKFFSLRWIRSIGTAKCGKTGGNFLL